MVTVTKLPPGPKENIPVVGRLYSIYHGDFVYFAKWPQHSWKHTYSSKATEEIRSLVRSVPYVMLTKISISEDKGTVTGSLLVGEKTLDFWIATNSADEDCLSVWQSFFIAACI